MVISYMTNLHIIYIFGFLNLFAMYLYAHVFFFIRLVHESHNLHENFRN